MIRLTYHSIKRLIFNKYILIGLILVAVFAAGILTNDKIFAPDLHRLYMESMMVNDQPPVVLIHGVLGSKLRNKTTNKDLWPGSATRLFLSDYSDIAFDIDSDSLAPMSDNIEAYAISEGAVGKDFYGKIVKTLGDAAGYKLAKIGDPIDPKQKNYYIFHYDWRQDNVVSSAQLADFIDKIQVDYKNLDLKVDIIAHSMGGLIARYYIRYGKQDVLEDNDFDKKVTMYGGDRVRRVVLLGTPNLGSVKTLNVFISGVNTGLKQIGTETLATMPSLYQLFPHPLNNWIVNGTGKPLDRDLFDVETWRRFQWSIFDPKVRERIHAKFDNQQNFEKYIATLERYFNKRLERARRFVWSLTVPLPERHPKLTIFGGGCTLTPARIVVEEVNDESLIRMHPNEITQAVAGVDYDALLLEPGDGSVTKASLLGRNTLDPSIKRHEYIHLPIKQSFFLCVKHSNLTSNLNFQDNLLNTLLSRDSTE